MLMMLQYLLPHSLISKVAHGLADNQSPILKSLFIYLFTKYYRVDLTESTKGLFQYRNFNDFFTRPLKSGIRPIDKSENGVISPVDGVITRVGLLSEGCLIHAKNEPLSVSKLLGNATHAEAFKYGSFITMYLAPRDYHRVHMPIDGKLEKMICISGRLFSLRPSVTARIPSIFIRNERVVNIFSTQIGKVAVVLVGAMVVGSIEMTWAGEVMSAGKSRFITYPHQSIAIKRGDEIGRFKFGSSVILLFQQKIQWAAAIPEGTRVLMGKLLGNAQQFSPLINLTRVK